MRLRSTLSGEQIMIWRKRNGLPADLEVRVPCAEERVQNPPKGWLTVCETMLQAGFQFPPYDEVVEILKLCGFPISQFTPLGMTRLMGLVAFFIEHDSKFFLN
ncbi:hypothetical protein KSP39_PZI004919 [Platanthera zijinensis]|uniref:Uncharacterized protein n=1 Tax=Platanthera zijinensis TaxID=2320716 RepID=A0AAP0BUQ8_9ASPA